MCQHLSRISEIRAYFTLHTYYMGTGTNQAQMKTLCQTTITQSWRNVIQKRPLPALAVLQLKYGCNKRQIDGGKELAQ